MKETIYNTTKHVVPNDYEPKRLTDIFHVQSILDFIGGRLKEDEDIDQAVGRKDEKLEEDRVLSLIEEFERDWPKEEVDEFVSNIKNNIPDAEVSAERVRAFMLNAHIRLSTQILNSKRKRQKDENIVNSLKAKAISEEANRIRGNLASKKK